MAKIRKSAEDYLEAMLILYNKHGYIRSVDVARQLAVTKPSVSYATKRLREEGYIVMDENGLIQLSDSGRAVAEHIYERHRLFTEYFIELGIDPVTARKDACEIEHDLSDETFDAVKKDILSRMNRTNQKQASANS
ncbi:MAG: metal-dependent transcriptional regulator [Eubacteriales bacterium]|nr:metal-dependent transcriptional regulator [Eubacteriales bacterium]